METLDFRIKANRHVTGRAHVGVVASGDLEVLMTARDTAETHVLIHTSMPSYATLWQATVERFCDRCGVALHIEINDFGATPGMVLLRLQQAFDTLLDQAHTSSVPHA